MIFGGGGGRRRQTWVKFDVLVRVVDSACGFGGFSSLAGLGRGFWKVGLKVLGLIGQNH